MNRKEYSCWIRLIITSKMIGRAGSLREICQESFERFAENHRKGNRSLIDFIRPVEISREFDPSTSGYRVDLVASYIKVPKKHYQGKIIWPEGLL